MESKYILDEVPVMITFDSDEQEAERLLLEAAGEVTKDTIAETKQEPFCRYELTDWGVRIRLRYQATAMERQRISSDIVRIVFEKFTRADRIRFCYPHTEIIYRPKEGERQNGRRAFT
jgi:small-conductance mechanosensitive channel